MFQKIIAFLVRSLRQDNRLWSVALLRLGMIGFTLFLVSETSSHPWYSSGSGLYLLEFLAGLNLWMIGLLGVTYFSSVITEEKEERTIGLLLMTGVSPLSIMLGKSVPKQLNAILLLSIQFPFTLLAITLGGVTIDQVIGIYVFLLVTLLAVANIGLLTSVVTRTSLASGVLSAAIGFVIIIGWILIEIVEEFYRLFSVPQPAFLSSFEGLLKAINPIFYYDNMFRTGIYTNPFGTYFVFYLFLSIFCFVLARILFPYFVKSDASEKGDPIIHRLKNYFRKKKRVYQSRESIRVEGNAFIWKDFNFQSGGRKMWKRKMIFYISAILSIGLFGALLILTNASLNQNRMYEDIFLLVISGCAWAMGIEAVFHLFNLFSYEIKEKSFGLFYMIPGTQSKKMYSKLAGNLLGMVPIIFMFLGSALMIYFIEAFLLRTSTPGVIYYRGVFFDFGNELFKLFQEPGFWFVISLVIFTAHFLVTATLFFYKAAIPLVVVGTFCIVPLLIEFNLYIYMFLENGNSRFRFQERHDFAFLSSALILLVTSFLLHIAIIPQRLEKLAASE